MVLLYWWVRVLWISHMQSDDAGEDSHAGKWITEAVPQPLAKCKTVNTHLKYVWMNVWTNEHI